MGFVVRRSLFVVRTSLFATAGETPPGQPPGRRRYDRTPKIRMVIERQKKFAYFLAALILPFLTGGCERVHDDRFARGGKGR